MFPKYEYITSLLQFFLVIATRNDKNHATRHAVNESCRIDGKTQISRNEVLLVLFRNERYSILCPLARINIWNVTGSFMATPSLPPSRIIYRIRVGAIRSRDTQATCIPSRFPFFGNPVPRFLPSPTPVEGKETTEGKLARPPLSNILSSLAFFSSFFFFFFPNKNNVTSTQSGARSREF